MAPRSLSAIERGTRAATVPELLGIAHATGAPVRYLTGRTGVVFRPHAVGDRLTLGIRDRMELLLALDAELDDMDLP